MLARTTPALLAAIALAAAGCGGDDDDEAAPSPSADAPATSKPAGGDDRKDASQAGDGGVNPIGSADVALSEFEVKLAKKSLPSEGVYTLEVVNGGKRTHALEAEGPNGESETEEIPPGESAKLDAYFVSGEYELYCPIGDHRDRGMTTKLQVHR